MVGVELALLPPPRVARITPATVAAPAAISAILTHFGEYQLPPFFFLEVSSTILVTLVIVTVVSPN
jgi:hypothetical protein